ncbi:helix-turn-helix domain-containing protein [Paenibacillus humicola]|uniref:helix-turn-helix domain-containing protein n=1 Tax=Paenibacillus humicola TaxID=3110540 RepID=UPI00237BCFE4|nr:AraC family transcriptional regulator [Paenibacillus humicola]
MLAIRSVHFDDFIPNWRTQSEVIEYNVLVLVTQGSLTYRIDGREWTGEQGDLIFIPQGTRRAGDNHLSGPHQKYSVLFRCCPDAAASIPFLKEKEFIRFKPRKPQYLQRRFERLYEEMREGEMYRSFVCPGIFQELIGLVARDLEKPEPAPMKTKYAEIIKRYLLDHYREQVEIHELARLIHRSPNYTTAVFREVTGLSPIKYMHQLRISEACSLLLNSDMTVSSIAGYLGYYDTSYFYRIFKKYTSMSPTDFMTRGSGQDAPHLFG